MLKWLLSSKLSARLPRLARSLTVLFLSAMAIAVAPSCGSEVIVYQTLRLSITSEAPLQGSITGLEIALLSEPGAPVAIKLPAVGQEADFNILLPAGRNIVTQPFTWDIQQPATSAGKLQVRVRGVDNGKVLSSFNGVIDTSEKAQFVIVLKVPETTPKCDADGDGVPNCTPECSPDKLAACDCNDDGTPDAKGVPKGFAANPYSSENACTQCGNNIDEDCAGGDTPCVDSDKDGVADCQEVSCGAGAEKDATIYPGAAELCDGKDNNCNGEVDEDLPVQGDPSIKKALKDQACGIGICKGVLACAPADKDGKSTAWLCSGDAKKLAKENCDNQEDDDCDGAINNGCTLKDIDGDGVDNETEDKACKFKYAKFHAEYHPGTQAEKCCLIAADKDFVCDTNCDGKSTPCDANDKDGDGQPAPADCDDKDPLSHTGAPEKCGDGKLQGCVGNDKCDSAKDKDGDGWYEPADCNDGDPKINPEAKELCDGVDNDCDKVVDDGNPEANDVECGDKDGECNLKHGTTVCKHYPGGQKPSDPLDCSSAFGAKNTCVGCEGDNRPSKDLCDYLDNNCDGKTDEDYSYTDEKGAKLGILVKDGKPVTSCDGVGACAIGVVECNKTLDKAVCSTDFNGSAKQNKPEICDNQDNDCNGKTDENLTTIEDSTCEKKGVCSGTAFGSIKTVCIAGSWLCNYAAVANVEFDKTQTCKAGTPNCHCEGLSQTCYKMIEAHCDGKDNDCDGKVDDDFSFDDLGKTKIITEGCGTGDCNGGKVVCDVSTTKLTCDSLPKITKEVCDAKDNDCNGKTDDGMTVPESNCKLVGACNPANVIATCPAGKWVCEYTKVESYEDSKEITCDAKDNDCDGKTDEDFDFNDLGALKPIGQGCGSGACVGGTVVCTGDKKGLTCSTLTKVTPEVCDTKDNDCNGKTDELWQYTQSDGQKLGWNAVCDGVGACGMGKVECLTQATVTCSTDANGSGKQNTLEICDDQDNDCNGATDEKCDDDKDAYCDIGIQTVGKPKACPQGGGDCKKDEVKINPGAAEICDDIDNNCKDGVDEGFTYGELSKLLVKDAGCGLGECSGGKVICSGQQSVTCSTLGKKAVEICDNKDNNCDGKTDEGCDDDGDLYCDGTMDVVGVPNVCTKTKAINGKGDDCVDSDKAINVGMVESCNNIDDNCSAKIDEGCDDDLDQYCDSAMVVVGKPTVCPKTAAINGNGDDCNDAEKAVNPGTPESCNDIDDNCSGKVDEGCDDDGDLYCDINIPIVGVPKICPNGGKDCNDTAKAIFPTATESCNDIDDNCAGGTDEGCDIDTDGYCTSAMTVVGVPKICPKSKANTGDDCNDNNNAINPGAVEKCNNTDDNCTAGVDEGCDDDGDAYCDSNMVVIGSPNVCPKSKANTADDCNDTPGAGKAVNPGATEICNDIDDNCSSKTDEGCDDDLDQYCETNMVIVGIPKVCPKGGGDCDDKNVAANPGKAELCGTLFDDNCDGKTNDAGSGGCVNYFKDQDLDGYGLLADKQCLCAADIGAKYTSLLSTDCDDSKITVNPAAKETCVTLYDDNCDGNVNDINATSCIDYYMDADGDNFGKLADKQCTCTAAGNYKVLLAAATDCDDTKIGVFPGQKETCTTLYDDNCDGNTNDINATNCIDYYMDFDNDTFGKLADKQCTCAVAGSYKVLLAKATDCDDAKALVFPGQKESCVTVYDDNCDGNTNDIDATGCTDFYMDFDGDTFGKSNDKQCSCTAISNYKVLLAKATDCDDSKALVFPGQKEDCGTNYDDNCDGSTNDVGATACVDHYMDADGDTFGKLTDKQCTCAISGNYKVLLAKATDCDDTKIAVFPGQKETCATLYDDNCDGGTNDIDATNCIDYYMDFDGDTFGKLADKQCTCAVSGKYTVLLAKATDCDDTNAAIKPGVAELCSTVGVDDNCTGSANDVGATGCIDYYMDFDGDTFGKLSDKQCTCTATGKYTVLLANATDCDDTNAAIKPGVAELCSTVGVDDNCSGGSNEVGATGCIDYYMDFDGDTFGKLSDKQCTCTASGNYKVLLAKATDCDDTNAAIKPGVAELCSTVGIDDNCSGSANEVGATGCTDFYMDFDGDTFGKLSDKQCTCTLSGNYKVLLANATDCDDTNAAIKPGATELCNNVDDNCNGAIDTDTAGALSTCLQVGECAGINAFATCAAGVWTCPYASIPASKYQSGPETGPPADKCSDGNDNNCDGVTDGKAPLADGCP